MTEEENTLSNEAPDEVIERLLRSRGAPIDAQGFWSPEGALDWPARILLRRLRLMRGWTQKGLAERAGMAQSHVAKSEAGQDIRLRTLEKLVAALGCRLSLRVRPIVPFEVR
ncbi:MAG: helix-turn-helix transcriptional regulator [Elusimicrobia bacterium]|nr:helix-turn-helix transcriptional regulator [Elusimicrobiota bacterium]